MAETPTDVLVAGYQDIDEATEDLDSLVALVRGKQVSIDGVILVRHGHDGSVAVRQTGEGRLEKTMFFRFSAYPRRGGARHQRIAGRGRCSRP